MKLDPTPPPVLIICAVNDGPKDSTHARCSRCWRRLQVEQDGETVAFVCIDCAFADPSQQ